MWFRHFKRIIPVGLASAGGLLLGLAGEFSRDPFFSAVRTDDKAATAAALCDPWPFPPDLGAEVALGDDDEVNAEFKAAKAEALWVGPPLFEPLDRSWIGEDLNQVNLISKQIVNA